MTMPVPKRIVKGDTVEIRCKLKREGRFTDARYTIPISSRTAKASCAWTTEWYCCPTTVIPWTGEVFRLYYTSGGKEQPVVIVSQ